MFKCLKNIKMGLKGGRGVFVKFFQKLTFRLFLIDDRGQDTNIYQMLLVP